MAQQYGTVKVDNITFTSGGGGSETDITLVVSGLNGVSNSGITVTGTISGETAEFISGVFTTQISGATITGDAGEFTSGTFVTATGTTAEFTSGVFTSLSGTTATVTSGVFASGTAAAPSVSVGTTDNGIYSPGTDQVAISSSGMQRVNFGTGEVVFNETGENYDFRIEGDTEPNLVFVDASTNRVGLGTSSPSSLLHLNESSTSGYTTFRLANSGASGRAYEIGVGGNTSASGYANNLYVYDATAAQPRVVLDSSGRVGIGTSSPAVPLHVRSTEPEIYLQDSDAFDSRSNIRYNAGVLTIGADDTDAVLASSLRLRVDGNEYMRIDDQGRVGIGTTSPAGTLDVGAVSGAVTTGDLTVTTGSTTAKVTIGRLSSTGNDNTAFRIRDRVDRDVLTVDASNFVYSQASSERARIDSSGRLLVGTSTASANGTLFLQGTNAGSTLGGTIRMAAGTTSPADGAELGIIAFSDSSHSQAAFMLAKRDGGTWTSGSSMPSRLEFSTTADGASSPTERMRINSDGLTRFKSGTYNTEILRATGDFTTRGFSLSTYMISGSVLDGGVRLKAGDSSFGEFEMIAGGLGGVKLSRNATSWTSVSDERLKTDLIPIEDGLAKVSALRSVTGRYIEDEESISRSFLIAQDVQAVLPEAVSVSQSDQDTLGLRYTEVIPLLVAALKEAKEKIETLEQRLSDAGIA